MATPLPPPYPTARIRAVSYLESGEYGNAPLLSTALQCAVPFWVERWKNSLPEQRIARAHELGIDIAETSDVVLYRSKCKGETTKAFNRLAEGIALLSFTPGGVHFLGVHFRAEPSP